MVYRLPMAGGRCAVAFVACWRRGHRRHCLRLGEKLLGSCLRSSQPRHHGILLRSIPSDTFLHTLPPLLWSDPDNSRRIGGPVDWHPGEALHLRIILDHSSLEIFTGSGEVLSTRVYRGAPLDREDSGLDLVSFGGASNVLSAEVYEMQSIWKEDASLASIPNDPLKDTPLFGMPEINSTSPQMHSVDPVNASSIHCD